MNKFLDIINKTYNKLGLIQEEQSTVGYGNQTIVDKIKKAIETGAKAAGNTDVQNVISSLFDIDKIKDNAPLQKAIDKIRLNPENPNLDQNELQAIMVITQDETTGSKKTTVAPNQNPPQQQKPATPPKTQQTSYNYNPNTPVNK
jgi:hypothetical protein